MALLDVACGTGFAARLAAAAVGASGRTAGLDINAGMLAAARAAASDAAAAIEWHEGSATALPMGDAEFDAVVCSHGLQFFPDLDQAVREFARVTRSGARVSAAFWMAADASPYMAAQVAGAVALGGAFGAAWQRLAAQAFALPALRVVQAFEAAGLCDVVVEEISVTCELPPLAQFVPAHQASLPVAAAFAALSDAERAAYIAAAIEALAAYAREGGGVTVPFASYVVTGTK
jgi:ubiquinone/menaquinone biosynthesis C-methylase UbiE